MSVPAHYVSWRSRDGVCKPSARWPPAVRACAGMTETVVHEWLADYGALSPVEVHTFASSLQHNQELVAALYTVLEERSRYQELIDPVCTQLFGFYRSQEVELQRFTLQFLPTLIFVYLNSVAHGDKKSCRSVETLLIGLYNLEAVDENGQPKVQSFRLPSLAQDSIYHEPMSLAPASLTASALRRLEECNTKLVSWGPLPQVEVLNAQNRLKVMTALLFVYNHQLSLMHKCALEPLCKVSSKLVTQGFNKPGHHQRSSYGSDSSFVPRLLPRIPVMSQFLLEFMSAIYFAMFNGFSYIATQALEDVYNRACYEGYPEVLLVTSAIRNSLQANPSGQPSDGPMGISVALSPATTTVTTVSKSMITNASFRTKKLPDDIPIQAPKDEAGGAGGDGKNLTSISEEQEEVVAPASTTPRGSSLRAARETKKLPNFPGLGKKTKEGKSAAALDKKESATDLKKLLQASVRGSVLSAVLNGEACDAADGGGGAALSRKKSWSAAENGPLSVAEAVADADSPGTAAPGDRDPGDTGDSRELPVPGDDAVSAKLADTPLTHRRADVVQGHPALQVSTV